MEFTRGPGDAVECVFSVSDCAYLCAGFWWCFVLGKGRAIDEISAYLNCSRNTAYQLMRSGRVAAVKLSNKRNARWILSPNWQDTFHADSVRVSAERAVMGDLSVASARSLKRKRV